MINAILMTLACFSFSACAQPEQTVTNDFGGVRMVYAVPARSTVPTAPGRRGNIDQPMLLAEAIKAFNEAHPDPSPLTVDEVVAAIRSIKVAHPDIHPWIYEQYQRVADEKVLLPGFYLSRMTTLASEGWLYSVDWRDLTFDLLDSHKPPPDFKGWGFNYRIRARFISAARCASNNVCSYAKPKPTKQ